MTLQIGLASNPIPPLELTIGQAVSAEADGYDSFWFPDHLMGWFPRSLWTLEASSIVSLLPSPHMYLDPTVVIALAGQSTSKMRLATGVTDPIRRPPAELARTFVTLSHATQGRAILGIGAGELENTVPYGLSYKHQASRLEEALEIIRRLWGEQTVDFKGRFWTLDKAVMDLPLYQDVPPPIWVGAHGPKMLDITGKYADGWYPSYPMSAEEYGSKLAVIRKAAEAAGRDPASIVAGYQMYAVVAEEHEQAHQIMSSPLAAAMSLVAQSSTWEKGGRDHPFGKNFEGLRDYVPEWHSPEQLASAVKQFDLDVIHPTVVHGTPKEVAETVASFVDQGLQHVVFANLAPLAGLEYVAAGQQGLREVAALLR